MSLIPLLLWIPLLFMFHVSNARDKPFIGVMTICTLYLSVLAPYYWDFFEGNYYAGVSWDPNLLLRSASLISVSSLIIALVVTLYSAAFPLEFSYPKNLKIRVPITVYCTLFFGIACSFYTVLASSGASDIDLVIKGNAIFLLAYQLSDLIIPSVVFLAACLGAKKRVAFLILGFVFFAIFVGFRYKIVMLMLPITILLIMSFRSRLAKLIVALTLGGSAVSLFTIMTLYRVKFSGIDINSATGDRNIFYGFMAESNVLFGMSSVVTSYLDRGIMHGLEPISDAFLALIPRAIFRSGEIGLYADGVRLGLISEQGYFSGTAYPLIGEFIIIGGWLGLIAGCIAYALIYVAASRRLARTSPTRAILIGGVGLLAAQMGYYHFTRGFLPQQLKGYLFMIMPYLVFVYLSSRQKVVTTRPKTFRPDFIDSRKDFP